MMVDDSWETEMVALLDCLGESPDAIEGAIVALAHLSWFVEQCQNHAMECHPADLYKTVAGGAYGWLNAARETLEPLRPEGATGHVPS